MRTPLTARSGSSGQAVEPPRGCPPFDLYADSVASRGASWVTPISRRQEGRHDFLRPDSARVTRKTPSQKSTTCRRFNGANDQRRRRGSRTHAATLSRCAYKLHDARILSSASSRSTAPFGVCPVLLRCHSSAVQAIDGERS